VLLHGTDEMTFSRSENLESISHYLI
jgi:hypothetical protein